MTDVLYVASAAPPIAADFPKLLIEQGNSVTVCAGMESALEHIHANHASIDCILTHIDLQDKSSGLELLDAIKDMESLQEKPVIVFASNANFKAGTDEEAAALQELTEAVAGKGAILVPVRDVYLSIDHFKQVGAETEAAAGDQTKLAGIAEKRLGFAREPFGKMAGIITNAISAFKPGVPPAGGDAPRPPGT